VAIPIVKDDSGKKYNKIVPLTLLLQVDHKRSAADMEVDSTTAAKDPQDDEPKKQTKKRKRSIDKKPVKGKDNSKSRPRKKVAVKAARMTCGLHKTARKRKSKEDKAAKESKKDRKGKSSKKAKKAVEVEVVTKGPLDQVWDRLRYVHYVSCEWMKYRCRAKKEKAVPSTLDLTASSSESSPAVMISEDPVVSSAATSAGAVAT